MTVIRVAGFAGENRAVHPKLLSDVVGTVSLNQKPGRGDLRPWGEPVTVAAVRSGRKTIYRMNRDTQSSVDAWLSWPTTVHAVRGFDAGDTNERTFYTGDGTPKVTDNVMGLDPDKWDGASVVVGEYVPPACVVSETTVCVK